MTKPTLGTGCSIDIERLIETRMLIQANSGAGKSWAIRRLLEQVYGKVQSILIDVDGEFHTLREQFDFVLAGQKGDCPADIKSAALLGRRLLELGTSAIVDIYELGTQKKLFVKRFLDSIVQAPRELWHPVLIVVDEAHIFCPEAGQSESASAVIDLMTLGRKRGFCGVLATQRISKLHKDAAAEANNKLIGRSSLDIDMKRASSELGFTSREDTQSLRTLGAGEFYAFGPALSVTGVQKIKVGTVKTTHLRAGQRAAPPTPPRARVQKVLAQLADLPHEAEAEARSLGDAKAKIKQLEGELRSAKKAVPAEKPPKTVEKIVIGERNLKRIEKIVARFEKLREFFVKLSRETAEFEKDLGVEMSELRKSLIQSSSVVKPAFEMPKLKVPPPRERASMVIPEVGFAPKPRAQSATTDFVMNESIEGNGVLPKGEKIVLRALIQHHPDGLKKEQLSVITGYKRQTRDAYVFRLKQRGYVNDERGGLVAATEVGMQAMPDAEPLPTGSDLREWHMNRLPAGEKIILEQLINAYPNSIEKVQLDELTEYKRQTRDAYLFRLRSKKLVEETGRGMVKASDTLFD